REPYPHILIFSNAQRRIEWPDFFETRPARQDTWLGDIRCSQQFSPNLARVHRADLQSEVIGCGPKFADELAATRHERHFRMLCNDMHLLGKLVIAPLIVRIKKRDKVALRVSNPFVQYGALTDILRFREKPNLV